jgi:hypothetical protein
VLAAKLHDNYVGAVVCSSRAHHICERGSTLDTGVIGIGADVGSRRDQDTITVNIDGIRGRAAPEEIGYVDPFDF